VYIRACNSNTFGLSSKNVNFIEKQKRGSDSAGKYSMRARVMLIFYIAATEIEFMQQVV